jgi:hypothetical protein
MNALRPKTAAPASAGPPLEFVLTADEAASVRITTPKCFLSTSDLLIYRSETAFLIDATLTCYEVRQIEVEDKRTMLVPAVFNYEGKHVNAAGQYYVAQNERRDVNAAGEYYVADNERRDDRKPGAFYLIYSAETRR